MGILIVAFFSIFLLIASGGMLLFFRQAMVERVSSAIHPRAQQKSALDAIRQAFFSIGEMVEQVERVLPKSQAEISVAEQRLIRAGYRKDSALRLFYGAKVLVPLSLCLLILASGQASANFFFLYAAAMGMGFLVPDFWLGRRIAARQRRMRAGLPDVLDLLVICVEAGLSLDQATLRAARELSKAQPELSDEFGIVVLEQGAERARSDAWRNLAERTGVESLRNLVSIMVQSEQFGTSIAKTLRIHSDTLRMQRIQQVEELASKTTIKLVFPLVLFIFPSLFLVTLGPAMILMSESFKTFLSH